jgi:hypothetical protein
MNKLHQFRKTLAENGIEMTPDQAKEFYKMTKDIIRRSKKMSMQHFWKLKETKVEGMTPDQIDELIKIYKCAKEI